MSRRGRGAGPPTTLGKRKTAAEAATAPSTKSRRPARETSTTSLLQQLQGVAARKIAQKKNPPKTRLLNTSEISPY